MKLPVTDNQLKQSHLLDEFLHVAGLSFRYGPYMSVVIDSWIKDKQHDSAEIEFFKAFKKYVDTVLYEQVND